MRCWRHVMLQGQKAQRTADDGMRHNKADIKCAVDLFCVVYLANVTALYERKVAQYYRAAAVCLVLACSIGLALLSKSKCVQCMIVWDVNSI